MNILRLTLRSLAYYRRSNLAALAGTATAVAVLVGSLLVGDSVQGSLRDLALQRLGRVEHALVTDGFFRAELAREIADELADEPGFDDAFSGAVSALMLGGSARTADEQRATPRVNLLGVPPEFWDLGEGGPRDAPSGRNAALSAALAEELDLREGDTLFVSVGREGMAPGDTVFSHQSRARTLRTLSVTVGQVLPPEGMGRFSLQGDRPHPHNLFVEREWLARQLEQPGRANALLVASSPDRPLPDGDALLREVLRRQAQLEDYGLRLEEPEGRAYLALQSARMVLSARAAGAARAAAEAEGIAAGAASVYLANTLRLVGAEDGSVPYSIVAALEPEAARAAGGLVLTDGSPSPDLGADQVLLNDWAADDLGASPGDAVEMTYYVRGRGGAMTTGSMTFEVAGVVPMRGAAADPDLVPFFEGITDVDTIGAWDPPFPVDLSRVRARDEDYWDEHRATPKAFVAPETMRDIWRSARIGEDWVTSVLAARPQGADAGFAGRYRRALLAELDPAAHGLAFRSVRQQALAAARGSTDFGMLFLSMSMFLVAAAAMLLGLMLRLNVERRAGQLGIMLAVGLPGRRTAAPLAAEAGLVALAGGAVGAPAGVGYARLIILGLHTWWEPAAGQMPFELHVTPLSLFIGFLGGLAVAALAIWWGIRLLRRSSAARLLAGWQAERDAPPATRPARRLRAAWVAGLAGLGAAALLVLSTLLPVVPTTGAFFGIGALLLVGALAVTALALRPGGPGRHAAPGLLRLAWRGARRNRVRSLLSAGLLAAASFMIVSVAVNRRDMRRVDVRDRASGAGGFTLVARSSVGIHADLSTPQGRERVGLTEEESEAIARAEIYQFRMSEGEDISCLNVQRPSVPRVLGVPEQVVERGGFGFAEHVSLGDEEAGRPWRLLRRDPDAAGGALPAFADAASARWILHKGVGDLLTAPAAHGEEARMELVGLLANTIFQSEALVAERHFVRHFGSESGYRYFLVETPPGETEAVAAALRNGLGEMGVEVLETGELLARFAGVQNTYLGTFQTLGGLGLLLGTLGLVTVLLRGVVERRAEFALMLAVGIPRRRIVAAVTLENALLLTLGLALGSVSALVAVAPHLASDVADVRWASLVAVLAACFAVGLVSCAAAAAGSVRRELLSALRSE